MKQTPIIEEHYIIIGSDQFQIVYDANGAQHDILIRGLFHWDSSNDGKIHEIQFMLDNLSTVETPFLIHKAIWCSNQNRIEIHIIQNEETDLRTQKSMVIPDGFDLEKEKRMEMVLRVYPENEPIDECEEFKLSTLNESEIKMDSLKRIVEQDKDGSILIGTRIFWP